MSSPHAGAPEPGARVATGAGSTRRRGRWRVGTPVVVLLSGSLFAVSAANSHGTDLRPGRYTDLASLVQGDADDYQHLRDEAASLETQVQSLGREVDDRSVRRRQRQVARLRGPAGLDAVSGPGVSVVLSDAPREALDAAAAAGDVDLNALVVHQQDIQAVVNALWAAGADAVTIQGQRVVTTTGIKCTGNAVTLQGVPYPQPYTIQAVGDPTTLESGLSLDPRVQGFLADAQDPAVDVGWDEQPQDVVRAPAFGGLLDLTSAEPIG